MQRLRPLLGGLPTEGVAAGRPPEPVRLPSCRVPWRRLHGVRHLLLCMPRARWNSRSAEGIVNKQLTKGNEAIVKAAVLAGCRAFYGYPITPASEITEAAALYFPPAGGVFVQAESEVAAVNMLYGA